MCWLWLWLWLWHSPRLETQLLVTTNFSTLWLLCHISAHGHNTIEINLDISSFELEPECVGDGQWWRIIWSSVPFIDNMPQILLYGFRLKTLQSDWNSIYKKVCNVIEANCCTARFFRTAIVQFYSPMHYWIMIRAIPLIIRM